MVQDHYTIFQVCRQVYHKFMDTAVLSGAIKGIKIEDYVANRRKYLRCRWLPHAWPYVHPEQDINAIIKAVDNNIDSLDDAVLRRGRDPSKVTLTNAKAQARIRKQRMEEGLPAEKQTGTPAKQEPLEEENE